MSSPKPAAKKVSKFVHLNERDLERLHSITGSSDRVKQHYDVALHSLLRVLHHVDDETTVGELRARLKTQFQLSLREMKALD